MKKSLLALAVLGAFATAAQADSSVTVFGIIDAGFMTNNNSAGGGRTTGYQDAQMLPSIYGFKGKEDLGGGLSAGFVLEGGFNSSNGEHNSPGVYQSQVFGREAKVTLGGDWGTIGAGQQVDPGLVASIGTEPRGMTDSFSMLEYWIIATIDDNGGLGGTSGSLTGGIFDVNSLTYTYAKNGLYIGVEYGFGGVAGNTSAGSTKSIGVSYTHAGFAVSGSYAKSDTLDPTGLTGGASEIEVFGLGYDFGPVALRGQYGEFKSGGLGGLAGGDYSSDIKSWGLGLDWKIAPSNKMNFSYYDAKDDAVGAGGKTRVFALMDTYSLSKRTSIYGQIAEVHADATAGLSSVIGGVYTTAGLLAGAGSTNYVGVGIQHSF